MAEGFVNQAKANREYRLSHLNLACDGVSRIELARLFDAMAYVAQHDYGGDAEERAAALGRDLGVPPDSLGIPGALLALLRSAAARGLADAVREAEAEERRKAEEAERRRREAEQEEARERPKRDRKYEAMERELDAFEAWRAERDAAAPTGKGER